MNPNKLKFIKAFEQDIELQRQNIDPLTHALPPTHYHLHPQTSQLLNKIRDEVSMLTTLGFTGQFFSTTRKMMLLDNLDNQPSHQTLQHSYNQLYLQTKIEIVPDQPIEWLYGEIRLKKDDLDSSLSPIRHNSSDFLESDVNLPMLASFLGSTVVIIELKDKQQLDQVVKLIQQIHERVSQISNCFPRLYGLYNAKLQQENQFNEKLNILRKRNICVELIPANTKDQWEQQYRLISIGKNIVRQLTPKIINKATLSPRLLALFWGTLALSDQTVPLTSIWQRTQNSLAEEHSQIVIQQYLSRIEDVTDGHSLVSSTFFKEAQARVRSDVMKFVTEKTGTVHNIDSIMRTERRLLEMKEQMQTKNHNAVQQWGKEFLKEAWSVIEQKINRDIKNIFGLRQQTLIFFEFFKKKSQQFISTDLLLLFVQFLIPKLFDVVQTITNTIVTPLHEQQMTLQNQLLNMASQNKDLRKRATREENELYRRLQQQQQRTLQLESSIKVSEQCLQLSKAQLLTHRQGYQSKLQAIDVEYQYVIKEKQKKIDQLSEQLEEINKKAAIWESELNKERLLHEQTKHFYEETVQLLKERQKQIRNQLEQVSLSASRQLIQLRQSSSKEIDIRQVSNSELLDQLHTQQQTIIQKNEQIQKMQLEVQLLQRNQTQTQSLYSKIHELELKTKIQGDIQSQYEILTNKYNKIEEQCKKMWRQKQSQVNRYQQSVTKQLLAQQIIQQFNKQIEDYKFKIKECHIEKEQLRIEKEELEEQVKGKEKNFRDACFQVQDSSIKNKLKIALETIQQLQNDYHRVRAQQQWQRRMRP